MAKAAFEDGSQNLSQSSLFLVVASLYAGVIRPTSINLTMFQRIANQDRTAVKECVDTYGSFIWALARKFTASRQEAEAATLEIFQDIWRYSKRGDKPQSAENMVISQIARRRLIRYVQ